ncbi:MAG: helix-turn-helix domain-containing protein, partial [Chloroflexota bacterium]|nr:helix-turn-helix domain-containing protein [Chloroflexota bacterium]
MTESLTFGRWMKRQRTELDLTQEALAEQVGCAPQTIRTYESGTRRPSRELAERLADVLQVPVERRGDFLHLARAAAGPARARPPVADRAAVQPLHDPPILTTKLYVPQLREDVIPRERLLDALGEALASRQLVLLSAPAGSGKTTLLVTALQTLPDLPVAWLALDEEDNDLIRFLTAMAAALQQIDPAFGATLQALLTAGGLGDYRDSGAQARRLISGLINEIMQRLPERFVLALDDLHRVTEPAVHLALDYLLERLPPQMTVALTTRYDPPLALARLRARRQLAEIRLEDLRFTLDETAMLLNDRFQLQLSPGDLQALQQRTEGWAA